MSDTGPVSGSTSLTRDVLFAACKANALFRDRYDLGTWTDLGHGSFAGVVRIHCRDRGEDVAVKIFLELSEDARARIRAEVANAQRIHSDLLVHLYAPFSSGDLAWIEMEYVLGGNLQREIERRGKRGFSMGEALDLGIATAEALRAAHQAGVVHRDLKPANLLLPESKRPLVKLGDFGTSKFHQAAKLTATGEFRGTPEYAAPEAWESVPVGPPADIYSLALVLFRLFTNGEYAYALPSNANTGQVYLAHKKQKPRRAHDVNPAVPEVVDSLLARGLAKNPAQRPLLEEVIATLKAHREAVGQGPAHSLRKPSTLWRRAALAIGIVLLTAATLLHFRRGPDNGIASRDGTPLPGAATPAAVSRPLVEYAVMASATPDPPSAPSTTQQRREDSALLFEAALDGPAIAITNASKEPVHNVDVVLMDDAQVRHTVSAIPVLGAGDLALLPLDEFAPPLPAGWHPSQAEVSGGTAKGRRAVSVAIGPK